MEDCWEHANWLAGKDNKMTLKVTEPHAWSILQLSPAAGTKDAKDMDVKYEPAKGDGGKAAEGHAGRSMCR